MSARRIAGVALLVLGCGSPPPPPPPSLPAPPSLPLPPPAPFPRPFTGPLDAAAFFPRVGDRWVRASTIPGVPSITSAITGIDDTGALLLETTNGPARIRVTTDEVALLDGLDHVIEVWLHGPIEVGTTWTDAGAPLGCTSTILAGPHEDAMFGRPVPACITIRAVCRGHDDSSLHMDTWCAGLGRVRSHVTETAGDRGGSYESYLSAFATGDETLGDSPATIEALSALPAAPP